MALLILFGLAVLALAYLPQAWVRRVFKRHSGDRADFPGTGGEFARHLLDRAGLHEVTVEATQIGDHYDPQSRTLRLTQNNINGRSLTAVVVAAHEAGHALQHKANDRRLLLRTDLAKVAAGLQIAAQAGIVLAPLAAAFLHVPQAAALGFGLVVLTVAFSVGLQLLTLPIEFDASFNKALPILAGGDYIPQDDLPAARQILRAAALTYVAATLFSLLNLGQLLRRLR